MRLVLIESPFAGDIARNVLYARACMIDCLQRGEAPFASHLLYTQILDDSRADHRALGIRAGLEWGKAAESTVVYEDRGVSPGMKIGIRVAIEAGRRVEYRRLGGEWEVEDAAMPG